TTDYYDAENTNLADRWSPMTAWLNERLAAGIDPYSKNTSTRISTNITAFDRSGASRSGINFASQEYLNLATDRRVIEAATTAAHSYGVHSAGSAALMGLTELTVRLEARIAQFLGLADATVFPTGWGAAYGAVRTLVRPDDHI